MKKKDNVGALISLSWDENKWEGYTDLELTNYPFAYIRDYLNACERLTFGHKKYPLAYDGEYAGYCRKIYQLMLLDEIFDSACNGEFVDGVFITHTDFKIIFFGSLNPNDKETYIVGFYAHPTIDWSIGRSGHKVYKSFGFSNIMSKVENIVRFDNYIPVKREANDTNTKYPLSLKVNKDGLLYLNHNDIQKILDMAIKLNPDQEDLVSAYPRLKSDISNA